MIEIERNIPVPEPSSSSKYPFDKLGVGDSIFIPLKQSVVSATVSYAKKKLGYKFTTRKAEKDGQSGYRVWRTA